MAVKRDRPVAEERDPPVTGGDEVLDGRAATAAVVAHNGIAAQEMRGAVDEDQCDAGLVIAHQVALVAGAWHDHQPVDAARGEGLGEFALALLGPRRRSRRR